MRITLSLDLREDTLSRMAAHLREGHFEGTAEQIEALLPKPKMAEPGEQGSYVRAHLNNSSLGRCKFIRIYRSRSSRYADYHWVNLEDGSVYTWNALHEPSRAGDEL